MKKCNIKKKHELFKIIIRSVKKLLSVEKLWENGNDQKCDK